MQFIMNTFAEATIVNSRFSERYINASFYSSKVAF